MQKHWHKRAVGVFLNQKEVEDALKELQASGFGMENVSVVAKNSPNAEKNISTSNELTTGAKTGALAGGALGTATGLFIGIGALTIPGLGPLLVAGAAATALTATVSGGVIGAAAGSLIGSLTGLGIPEERAQIYNERISHGHYLIMVEGTSEKIHQAELILSLRGIQEWGIYDSPSMAPAGPEFATTSVDPRDDVRITKINKENS